MRDRSYSRDGKGVKESARGRPHSQRTVKKARQDSEVVEEGCRFDVLETIRTEPLQYDNH